MTTRHLKIFLEVYKSGSMTAAAKRLFMTQPSVSQAIHEMEEHYGVRLFERLYRKLYPTPAGKELVLYAENILGLFDEMEAKLEAERSRGRGTRSVTFNRMLAEKLMLSGMLEL